MKSLIQTDLSVAAIISNTLHTRIATTLKASSGDFTV